MRAQPDRISWSTGARMTRPGSLAITVVGCVLGIATATTGGNAIEATTAVATVLVALVAHAALNVLNDYHDALNGADAANTDGVFPFTGGARLIQDGEVSTAATRRLAIGLLILVVPGGLLLAVHSGWGLLLVGLVGLLIGWMYSAPPLALMSRGLGEAAVAVAWVLVVIGADYALRGEFSRVAAFAGVGYGLPHSSTASGSLPVSLWPRSARSSPTGGNHFVATAAGPARTAAGSMPRLPPTTPWRSSPAE